MFSKQPQNRMRPCWSAPRHLSGGQWRWKMRKGITVGTSSFWKLSTVHPKELTSLKASILSQQQLPISACQFFQSPFPDDGCSPFSMTTTLTPTPNTQKIHLRTKYKTFLRVDEEENLVFPTSGLLIYCEALSSFVGNVTKGSCPFPSSKGRKDAS